MRDGSELFNQALVALRDCVGLERSEELLILWDGTVSQELVAASRYAALALGARPLLLSYEPAVRRPLREFGLFAGASLSEVPPSFPRCALGAMAVCDRLVLATSDLRTHFSPKFWEAVRRCAVVSFPYLTTESALRLLPESREEVHTLAELTRRVAEAVVNARRARVTSTAGTDLTLSLGRYPVNVHDGLASPGRRQLLPTGQVSRTPDDGSAEGLLVIDRSIAANDCKDLPEPVRMTVERGTVTSISGGADADRLRLFLAGMNDPNIYHLTELGIGTNRRCRFTGVAPQAEDTHTFGCVSLALGCDTHQGGAVRAGAHIDMTMRVPSLELDGNLIVDHGNILLA